MEKKFVANKGVVVDRVGRILLIRESGIGDHSKAKGKLDFPGGRMDANEMPRDALIRELTEELGINAGDFEVLEPLHVDRWGVNGDVENNPIIGIFHLVRLKEGVKITLSDEHTELIWMNPQLSFEETAHQVVFDVIDVYRKHFGITVGTDERIKGREGYGLIQVFTGNGKGKTTAALGEVIRARAVEKKVGIVYFDKGGETHYSERHVLEQIEGIDYVATGRDRIDPDTGRFDFSVQDTDKQEAQRGLSAAQKMFDEGCDLVVLDEINSTTDLGMLKVSDVLKLLDSKPDNTEVIMTGRHAPKEFLDRAHLITQMRLHRHYFYSGVPAREGLDY